MKKKPIQGKMKQVIRKHLGFSDYYGFISLLESLPLDIEKDIEVYQINNSRNYSLPIQAVNNLK